MRIAGPVIDIRFENGNLPKLLNAIEIYNRKEKVICEASQHIGDDMVRCIAMNATDGLRRGIDAVDTGSGITVPVGDCVLGRMFNLLGEPIDNKSAPKSSERRCIHRNAPSYDEQNSNMEILETGIKVVDLIAPYAKGR